MIRLFLFLSLAFWQIPAFSFANSLVLESAYFKDTSSALSVEQVRAAPFQNYQGSLGLGFEPGAVWVRLTLAQARATPDGRATEAVLQVGPHHLERVDLFVQTDGQWTQHTRGVLFTTAANLSPDGMHSFEVAVTGTEPTQVFLRMEHTGFLVTQVSVLSRADLPKAVAARVQSVTVSWVLALCLLGLGLVFLFSDRSLLLLVYCVFQLTVVLFIAALSGLITLALPSVSPEVWVIVNRLFFVLRVTVTVLIAWALLQPHKITPIYLKGIQLLLVVCALNAVLLLTGHVRLALRSSFLVFSVLPLWQLYGIWTASQLPVQQRRLLTFGTGVYLVMLLTGLWLNLTEASWLPAVGPVKQVLDLRLNGVAVGVIFFWITMLEHKAQKKIRAQEMEVLRQQAMQARTQQAELNERSALIDMLTHELKNPLGTVRFALASLKQQAQGHKDWLMRIQSIDLSTRRMDELIERVAHFNKMERSTATSSPSPLDASVLIKDLLSEVSRPEQWQLQVAPGTSFCCDRQLLTVILDNLMTNASKYALRDRPICIEVSRPLADPVQGSAGPGPTPEGLYTRFEISNHVDPDSVPEASRIFDRYYRHPQAQSQPGMGLGLSVVKTAAQKIGAHISYRHADGQVFFTLLVPA